MSSFFGSPGTKAWKLIWPYLSVSLLFAFALSALADSNTLLNVSFDVSRQLFQEINPAFVKQWKIQTGQTITINQSHAGSSKQARAVLDGLEADVVTLNQVTDVDLLAANKGFVPANWQTLLPHQSSPYFSTIIFVVRKGNSKAIKDWDDLVKPGISVIVPNPKTSGNGRYSYLGAYAFALKKFGNDEDQARKFVATLFANVPVLDIGGRGATTTFLQHDIGDVLLTFEAEALQVARDIGPDKLQIVNPSQSIEADMPVAVVEKFARRHGTEKSAKDYLDYLYSEEAQKIIAKNFYRPRSEKALAKYPAQFGHISLVTVDDVFGGWQKAQSVHFAADGFFDQIYKPKK